GLVFPNPRQRVDTDRSKEPLEIGASGAWAKPRADFFEIHTINKPPLKTGISCRTDRHKILRQKKGSPKPISKGAGISWFPKRKRELRNNKGGSTPTNSRCG